MLAKGTRLGSYQIGSLIGVGGMGEVYRAHDTRLGREVAIKVLPREVAGDADQLARFEREARALAAINHPNIAALHGVEEGEQTALVMELVDGETLAEICERRLRTGRPMPVADALAIARQIAAALEAAHAKGIVHRDLKPANVKVGANGIVKVLDFGVAKVLARDSAAAAREPAVTMIADATREGHVLGTTPYMSPEQARGLPVDEGADVWAFGCVLYELLTGRRAFAGATESDTIAAVLEHDPDWSQVPAATPGLVVRLLRRCLHKDPNQRLRDIGAVRVVIDEAAAGADSEATRPAGTGAPGKRPRLAWLGTGVAGLAGVGVVAALATHNWTKTEAPGAAVRLSLTAPGPITPQLSGAISPDGTQVAFVATGPSGRSMLWIRPLDAAEPRELPGTDRAAHPFWSPDSRSLGFVADAKLKRINLAGGPVQTLADLDPKWRSGGSWSRDGVILFAPAGGKLASVPAGGGPVTPVLATETAFLWWPDFLPDGRHFLFYAEGKKSGVFVGSLDSTDTKFVLASDVRAKYAAPGYLLFLRGETLMAQPFDLERLELGGEPRPIADGLWFARGAHHTSFSTSLTGTLAYVNSTWFDRQLVWFDRGGHRVGNVGPVYRDANGGMPQLSPDGQRVAVTRGELNFGDVWIFDAALGTWSRMTFGDGRERREPAVWLANGRKLVFRSERNAVNRDLQDGSEEALLDISDAAVVDCSKDGRFLLLSRRADLWVVDLAGDRRPERYLEGAASVAQAQLSPDGHWVAYTANETGRDEVYVQSFPVAGHKRQISADGGAMPRWRGDGRELFYLATGQMIMAVAIADPASLDVGQVTPLFRTRLLLWGSEAGGLATAYDVSADGQRFLLAAEPENSAPPMTVVLNWRSALNR